MKNLFLKRGLFLISLFTIAIVNFIHNYIISSDFIDLIPSIVLLLPCIIVTIIMLIDNVRIKHNYDSVKKELIEEYDERDDLIEGKSSKLTLNLINILCILVMVFSGGKNEQMNITLFSILFIANISNQLIKKYYEKTM